MAAEGPSVSGVSGRYATALFELARDEKSIDAVNADLDKFDAMLSESADLKRLVRSPVFAADAQSKAIFRANTNAQATDMETHIAARAAHARNIPFAALRVISDAHDHTLPPAALNTACPAAVSHSMVRPVRG